MKKIIDNVVFYAFVFVSAFVFVGTIIYSFIPQKNSQQVLQKIANFWSKITLRVNRINLTVLGSENIPQKGPLIIVSNHQGNADIPIILSYIPLPIRFVIKKELFWFPIFGWWLKRAGYLSLDRGSGQKAKKTLEHTVDVIKSGECVLIFPEGTRTHTGEIDKFKTGATFLAQQTGSPILPLRIKGSFEIQPRGKFSITPGPAELYIGKPFYLDNKDSTLSSTRKIEEAVRSLG